MNYSPPLTEFFVAGGTLRPNTPSYVMRPADDELYEATLKGEFCYVLTPRQMGKSSLMIRTSRRLEENGVRTAIVDLTKIGTKVTVEQWYTSLFTQIIRSLKLKIDVSGWMVSKQSLSYVQVLIDFIDEILLAKTREKIIIFVDEIDSTLGLDFRDDFFAGIRALYNARAENPKFERITFVLLGVASPTDLISDTARTPFNIGQAISLQEFSFEDAEVLQKGLDDFLHDGSGERILKRIFYWTSGHPYLTQKLCTSIVDSGNNQWEEEDIDNLAHVTFLSEQARNERNLKFVQGMILKSGQYKRLLIHYRRILSKLVEDDGQSTIHNKLKLSGIVKEQDGELVVRNRIYMHVFNIKWVNDNLPKETQKYLLSGMGILLTALIAILVFDFSVGMMAGTYTQNFFGARSPGQKLAELAKIFRLKGILQNKNLDYSAQQLFFSLPTIDEQEGLFLGPHVRTNPEVQEDLITVIEGLYVTLANIDNQTDSTYLLEIMSHSLENIDSNRSDALRQEINHWIDGRKKFDTDNLTEALSSYNNAIILNSENRATRYERAKILLLTHNYSDALKDLDKVIAIARESTSQINEEITETPETTIIPTNTGNIGVVVSETPTLSESSRPSLTPDTSIDIPTITTSSTTTVPQSTIQPTYTPTQTPMPTLPDGPFRSSFLSYIEIITAIREIVDSDSAVVNFIQTLENATEFPNLQYASIIIIDTAPNPEIASTTGMTEAPTSLPLVTTVHVLDAAGNPVEDVQVRIRDTESYGEKDDAVYRLPACGDGEAITAWATGYYINWVECKSSDNDYTLNMRTYEVQDWTNYTWQSARIDDESGLNCRHCHEAGDNPNYNGHPIYNEWSEDKHSRSAMNPYFFSLYNGSWFSPGLGPPQTGDIGPGYKLDNPLLNGNCAACHVPLAVVGEAVEVDLNTITPLAMEGINCDFCHKILDVHLSAGTNLPYPDRPGLLSYNFVRPSPSQEQVLVGPLKDAENHLAIASPIFNQSEYCAPCHYGVFWDTPIYSSYREWLESSYSNPETGQTCQDCHMADIKWLMLMERVLEPNNQKGTHPFYNHNMMVDIEGESLLKRAVDLAVNANYDEGKERIIVNITVGNVGAGHKVPTDSPLRHLIVLVQVSDDANTPLPQLEGDTVPEWGGLGSPDLGYYGGLPGTSFGYILMDKTNNIVPAVSYWNPTEVILDTRIPPFGTGKSYHEFASPEGGNAVVKVEVIYRYAFKELMDQKGWFGSEVEDVVIARREKMVEIP